MTNKEIVNEYRKVTRGILNEIFTATFDILSFKEKEYLKKIRNQELPMGIKSDLKNIRNSLPLGTRGWKILLKIATAQRELEGLNEQKTDIEVLQAKVRKLEGAIKN